MRPKNEGDDDDDDDDDGGRRGIWIDPPRPKAVVVTGLLFPYSPVLLFLLPQSLFSSVQKKQKQLFK